VILKSTRIALEAIGFLVAGLAVLLGLGVWRLSSGPVEVDFVTPYIEDALSRDGMRLSIDGTSIRWNGFDRPLDLVAEGVELYGGRALPIARVPAMSLSLSVRGLLQGELVPRRIELLRPHLRVERLEDGAFRFGLADAEAPSDTAASEAVGRLLSALRGNPAISGDPLAAIDAVSVTGGRITLDDRMLGINWYAPVADIDLRRTEGGVVGTARLDVELEGRTVRLEADLDYGTDTGTTRAELRVDNLVPADLADRDPVLAPLAVLASPVRGTIRASFGTTFVPLSTTFILEAGAGVLRIDDFYPEPVRVASLALSGEIDLQGGVMSIERFAADLGGPRLEGRATVTDRAGLLDIAANAAVTTMPTDLLATYWPPGVGRNAREWVTKNLSRGIVRRAELDVVARAPARDLGEMQAVSLDGRIEFDGVTVTYLESMPPVTHVAGSATFDLTRFAISVAGGSLRDLAVTEADVVISGLETKREVIDIEIVAAGPVGTVLEVLDHPPLGYPTEMGIDPAEVSGMMSTRLRFAFPLVKDLRFEDVALAAAANVEGATLGEVSKDLSVAAVTGALSLDGRGLELRGTAALNGVPVELSWNETFGAGEPRRRIVLAGTLDEAGRAALDLPDWPGLSGQVPVRAVYSADRNGRETLDAELDLTPARLAIEEIGWSKEPGLPGRADLLIELERGSLRRISSFGVDAPDLSARGDLAFARGTTEVAELNLADFASGRNRFRLRAVRQEQGGYSIELRGQSLDTDRLLDSLTGEGTEAAPNPAGETAPAVPVQATLALDRVYVSAGDGAVYGANGVMIRNDGRWSTIDLAARTDTGAPLRLNYGEGDDGVERLVLTSDDAGATLRALDLTDSVEGGILTIGGRRIPKEGGEADTVFAGSAEMRGFRVVRAPALARLLAALSLPGLNNVLSSDGIGFDRLVAQYRLDGDVLSVSDARTSGGALGLTLAGSMDLAADQVDFEGTIVPLYGVNQVIGAIPLLGDLLTGGEGQGVFAFTYGIEGPLDDPRVTVNPLSVLAPGFLRNLFFLEGDGQSPRGQ